jgi:uncharacterized protein (DUF362 family)
MVPDPKENLPEGAISRREFLWRVTAAGIAAAAAGGIGFALHNREAATGAKAFTLPDFSVPPMADRPRIVASHVENVEKTIVECLDRLGGIKRFIQPGDEVIVKPNVGFSSRPSLGATTNPDVVATVVRLCRQAGAKTVWVVDNPINDPARCMKISGIADAATVAGARVILPTPEAFVDVEQPNNKLLKRWPFLYAPFRKATKIIGIPVTKQHHLAGATLSMKNWYGLLGGNRIQLHQDINTSIADLATFVRPTFVVLDATRVMFRNGPTGGSAGDVRADNILAVATDQVALDTYGASLLDRKPDDLPYLKEAEKRGLGTTDLKSAGFEMISGAKVGGGA